MRNGMLIRSIGMLVIFTGATVVTIAAEPVTTLDLVSSDAALCLEIPHLDESWTMFEKSPLMDRIRALPAFQRILDSQSFQQLKDVEGKVAQLTGQKLSSQLRAVFGKSLAIAVYVPPDGIPQGILIGEATDAQAIPKALSTWLKLDPHQVATSKTDNGRRYSQLRKPSGAAENIFYFTSDRWIALSDQEKLIQDVSDRFTASKGTNTRSLISGSLRESRLFQQNRQRLKADAAAYLYVSARPWDRGLEEASRNEREPINPAFIWKHVNAVSASLQIAKGLICDAVVELDAAHQPSGWPQFVATASSEPSWSRGVPADALLAVSGHLEISPLLRFFIAQVQAGDAVELAKNRRLVQSLLGGQELLDVVLPVLAKDFCGYVVTRTEDHTKRVMLDGSLGFHLNSPGDAKLLQDVAHGLETALSVLAVYFSAEGKNVVVVKHEQNDSMQLSWLSESAPIPIAYGVKGQNLVIAGSQERLRKTIELIETSPDQSRLNEHSRRYFPNANQLVWFDAAKIRQTLERNGYDLARLFSNGSDREAKELANRLEQARPFLELVDSLFVAGRIESDHVRVIFGGGLDSK